MGHDIAEFLVYMAHLSDGNLVTDLLSIGKRTSLTGQDPPDAPAAGGLNKHGTFEGAFYFSASSCSTWINHFKSGDSSMTRGRLSRIDIYIILTFLFKVITTGAIIIASTKHSFKRSDSIVLPRNDNLNVT